MTLDKKQVLESSEIIKFEELFGYDQQLDLDESIKQLKNLKQRLALDYPGKDVTVFRHEEQQYRKSYDYWDDDDYESVTTGIIITVYRSETDEEATKRIAQETLKSEKAAERSRKLKEARARTAAKKLAATEAEELKLLEKLKEKYEADSKRKTV